MNPGPLVFLATFFVMALSWLGFVLAPQLQIGRQQPVEVKETGLAYPPMRPGLARQGEQIYRANGCFYCHSQQVRPKGFGSDVERGWGARNGLVQSVNEDYLYNRPVMLGSQRIGPDLTNFGLRQTNEAAILVHLYNPKFSMPTSVMPPFRFLFERRPLKLGQTPSADALPSSVGVEPGYEMVPKDEARALVAYLLSLHSDGVLYETPPFPVKTNAVAAATSTNAPVGAGAAVTNSSPTNSLVK
ncbi:MAG: cytochrome-c oxidase [Pedosphaera sp.]|nr:cytochrome-c oxidase [Pedosphaera sp.]